MNVEALLSKLVSFPVLGGESNTSIIEWIKSYIEDFGVTATLVPDETGNKASLHCRIGPAVDGGWVLSGHTDVVPVVGQAWDTDPFVLTDLGDGNLYGRGSCDMKGFLACCLFLLPEMVKADLKKPLYFAFSYDEEIGCLAAPALIRHFQNHYTESAKFALIGEPSLMQPVTGQKGICTVKTHVNGSAGHSSRIRQEVSALHESARLTLWLEDKMNSLASQDVLDERFTPPHTSLHVGQMNGGIAPNVIADSTTFAWDVRTIPKDDVYEIIESFKAHCRAREEQLREVFPGFKIDVWEHHPPVPPLDTANGKEIVQLTQELSGNHKLGAVAYASEAGQFAEAGFQSIICGPGSIDQAHRANEFIAKSELEQCVAMLRKLIGILT